MGVYIKGMRMPASCYDCDLCYESMDSERDVYWTCPVLNMDVEKYERMEDCPLVEVPEPHGRLIDADALCEGRVRNDNVVICAKCAPTIIQASEEGET